MKVLNKTKIISLIVTLSLVIGIMSPLSTVKAAVGEITDFWISFSDGEKSIDSINWLYRQQRNYLFMPTEADLTKAIVHFNATDDVKIRYTDNGQQIEVPITDGQQTDVFSHFTEPNLGRFTAVCGSQNYTITLLKSENIPSAYITLDKDLSYIHQNKENKSKGEFKLVKSDGTVDCEQPLKQLKGRGNATWELEKKPYNIKFDEKVDLLGMGASKGWCLIANYTDRSQARNELAYTLGLDIGVDFCSQSHPVNLYVNNEYQGVYHITEKVDIGKNNVDITDLEKATEKVNTDDLDSYPRGGDIGTSDPGNKKWYDIPNDPDDITGGYLLEFDLPNRYRDEASGFVTNQGQPVVSKYPEFASEKQIKYISSFVQDMEDAAYSSTGKNSKGKHYTDYIDMDSLAKAYIIQELAANLDNVITSFFIYKDSDLTGDGKLHFAPLWDFDNGFGGSYGRYGVNLRDPRVDWTERGIMYESDHGTDALEFGTPHLMNKLYNQGDRKLINEARKQWFGAARAAVQERFNSSSPKSFEAMRDYKYVAVSMMDSRRWGYGGPEFENDLDYVEGYLYDRAEYFDEKFFSNLAPTFIISGVEDVVLDGDTAVLDRLIVKNCKGELLRENIDYTVEYENNDHVGEAKATVIGIGNYSGRNAFAFNIIKAPEIDLSEFKINDIPSAVYTGKEMKPAIAFAEPYSGLKADVDYALSYENNVKAGTAAVTVTGINKYTGSQKITFKILPADVSKATVSGVNSKAYAGKAVKQTVKVAIGSVALKEGTDYRVKYINNNNPGKASVTITGINNYSGTKIVNFNITLKKVSKIKVKARKKSVSLSITRVAGAKKYEICCASNNKFKKARVIKTSKLKLTVSKLKSKKLCYIKVRAINKSVRGSYSKVYKVRIK